MIASLSHDALVVGGGPAGSALAIALAVAGKQVLMVEKSSSAQHKVCGEFLSPESLPYLRRIGINPQELGARTIRSVRMIARDILAEAPLPVPALSLSRKGLDEALLRRAQRAGVSLLRGYTAQDLSFQSGHSKSSKWQLQIASSARGAISVEAPDVFLATGKHDLRGWSRTLHGPENTLVALKMYFELAPKQRAELTGNVELIVYPGGYAGLQEVECGANLCVLITREKLQSFGGRWDHLLDYIGVRSHHLSRRLSGAVPLLDRPLAISSIPYGYCAETSSGQISPWRLGDQAAVIPSFCGDGIAIALHTAQRATEFYLEGSTATAFHAHLRRQFERRLYAGAVLSRLLVAVPSLAKIFRLWPSMLSEIFTATRIPGSRFAAASISSHTP